MKKRITEALLARMNSSEALFTPSPAQTKLLKKIEKTKRRLESINNELSRLPREVTKLNSKAETLIRRISNGKRKLRKLYKKQSKYSIVTGPSVNIGTPFFMHTEAYKDSLYEIKNELEELTAEKLDNLMDSMSEKGKLVFYYMLDEVL